MIIDDISKKDVNHFNKNLTYSSYRLEDYKYRVLFDKKELFNLISQGEEDKG